MALHLVTSAQEEDHISSSDDARLYEAIVGSGGIVFGRGNKMAASMTDPNTMRIMDGEAMLSGRYWNITGYEEVSIANGTPGMNSIALVVCNVKTDPQEVVTLKVYEGVETEGEPVMPSYIEGNLNAGDTEAEMPLYAITKTGLSIGDPAPQFDIFASIKEFRDSISQPIKTTQIEDGCTLYYYPDNTVEINVYDMVMSGINTWTLGTLDRPPLHVACMAIAASNGDHTGTLWVESNGDVKCHSESGNSYNYSGNMRIPLS